MGSNQETQGEDGTSTSYHNRTASAIQSSDPPLGASEQREASSKHLENRVKTSKDATSSQQNKKQPAAKDQNQDTKKDSSKRSHPNRHGRSSKSKLINPATEDVIDNSLKSYDLLGSFSDSLNLNTPTTSQQSSSNGKSILTIDTNMTSALEPVVLSPAQQAEYLQHRQFLRDHNKDNRSIREEEARTAPLFVGSVMTRVPALYSQYGLLGQELPESPDIPNGTINGETHTHDPRVMLNVGAPWSSFICGQQGSGKSHSLSVILENCLVASPAGRLPKPLSGMIFHWDRFTGYSSNQICEAAYLASAGIPVRVLVSPSNLTHMRNAYENLPGITNAFHKPKVMPLLFHEKQLNVKRMLTMMGVKTDGDQLPLYLEVILRILRDIAQDGQGHNGLNYAEFRTRLAMEEFTGQQNGPLKLRLELLESFLRRTSDTSKAQSQPIPQFVPPRHLRSGDRNRPQVPVEIKPLRGLSFTQEAELKDAWTFKPGMLTIVDLSCPFVDENAACALFTICLELFLEDRSSAGRVVALDEAHKFLTGSTGALSFTEELLQVIRQQRHLGTRVVIATQEPTISPKLLELCNFTIVHRFQSPGWFKTLQAHLAGASHAFDEEGSEKQETPKDRAKSLFKRIVNLQCGQALLFAPSALTGFMLSATGNEIEPVKLGMQNIRMITRQRLTADGGRSIMAE